MRGRDRFLFEIRVYLATIWRILEGMHTGARFGGRALVVAACVAGTAAALAVSVTLYARAGADWTDVLHPAGQRMLAGDLAIYTHMPDAQVGPLALLFAGSIPFPIYVVAVCCLFSLFVVQVYRASRAVPRLWHVWAFIALGLIWNRWAMMGHLDDVLVILAGLGIVIAGQRDRPRSAALWFAVALAGKPTAIMLLPLVALWSPGAALVGLLAGGAIYLPFAVTDLHGFLSAGRGVVFVWPHSLLSFLGVPAWGDVPAWVRPTQLLGVLLIGWLVGRRSLLAGLAAVLVFRPLLEPGSSPSYVAAAMLIMFCLELRDSRHSVLTGLLATAWLASFMPLSAPAALLRDALLVTALVAVALRPQESGSKVVPFHTPPAVPSMALSATPSHQYSVGSSGWNAEPSHQ